VVLRVEVPGDTVEGDADEPREVALREALYRHVMRS
jgi:hypothetical protein